MIKHDDDRQKIQSVKQNRNGEVLDDKRSQLEKKLTDYGHFHSGYLYL